LAKKAVHKLINTPDTASKNTYFLENIEKVTTNVTDRDSKIGGRGGERGGERVRERGREVFRV